MKKHSFLPFLAAFLAFISPICAAPEPTKAKVQNIWTLNVAFEQPQQIVMRIPGQDQPARFWYMIISLTNKTNQDVTFFPAIQLTTDTLQSVPAGRGVRTAVFDKIRLRHQGKYPFLESLESTDSRLLQGQDNTKDIAVIFPDFDPNAKSVKIFISGLSNETAAVDDPADRDANGVAKKLVLAKTLELDYSIPGDKTIRDQQTLNYTGQRWVMR